MVPEGCSVHRHQHILCRPQASFQHQHRIPAVHILAVRPVGGFLVVEFDQRPAAVRYQHIALILGARRPEIWQNADVPDAPVGYRPPVRSRSSLLDVLFKVLEGNRHRKSVIGELIQHGKAHIGVLDVIPDLHALSRVHQTHIAVVHGSGQRVFHGHGSVLIHKHQLVITAQVYLVYGLGSLIGLPFLLGGYGGKPGTARFVIDSDISALIDVESQSFIFHGKPGIAPVRRLSGSLFPAVSDLLLRKRELL